MKPNCYLPAFALPLVLAVLGGPTVSSYAAPEATKKKIVFVHGAASHGYGGHAYGPAFRMLARILNATPAVSAVVVGTNPDLSVLETADAIVLGSDGGGLVKKLGDRLEPLMTRGVGLACIHYTVDPTDPKAIQRLITWIGGAYEQHWSVNPFWEAEFKTFPTHPVSRGLKPFKANDEWYYHMRFAADTKGLTPILSAVPPEATRQGPTARTAECSCTRLPEMPEVVAWVYERPGGSGSPACTRTGPGRRTVTASRSSTRWSGLLEPKSPRRGAVEDAHLEELDPTACCGLPISTPRPRGS
ncbi:MAG: hypothetical protein HS113_24105 [Verrucomicrobiales bacterium]|nr:hypothetical protein [Verrucomicrobiales bacterium]